MCVLLGICLVPPGQAAMALCADASLVSHCSDPPPRKLLDAAVQTGTSRAAGLTRRAVLNALTPQSLQSDRKGDAVGDLPHGLAELVAAVQQLVRQLLHLRSQGGLRSPPMDPWYQCLVSSNAEHSTHSALCSSYSCTAFGSSPCQTIHARLDPSSQSTSCHGFQTYTHPKSESCA